MKPEDIIKKAGVLAKAFPSAGYEKMQEVTLPNDIEEVSDKFHFAFENSGLMRDGVIYTAKYLPKEEKPITLGEILEKGEVDKKFFITREKMPKWEYLKGAKKIERTSSTGYKYIFSEGAVAFPDAWDKPSRTMLTSESTLNRSTHVVSDMKTARLRLLTPLETERLQGFDDNWTDTGMPDRMRYFCMGNALVVPMITRIGKELDIIVDGEK